MDDSEGSALPPPATIDWRRMIVPGLIVAVVLIVLLGANAVSSGGSSDPCERLWQENKTTASIPFYADNGHAHYIETCHENQKTIQQLRDSGVIKN